MRELKYRQAIFFENGNFRCWYDWGFTEYGFVPPYITTTAQYDAGEITHKEAHKNSYQYTGREDNDGTEIYGGDIIEDRYWNERWFTVRRVVEIPDIYSTLENHRQRNGSYIKIIGNVVENPELMEEKK